MPKKDLFYFVFPVLLFSSFFTYKIYAIAANTDYIPPRKSSETIEDYKNRVRVEIQNSAINQANEVGQDLLQANTDSVNNQNKEQVRERVCEETETRVAERLEQFKKVKETHLEKYNRLLSKLTEVSLSLKAEGYNVAELEEDTEELEVLINSYESAYGDFISSLLFVKGFACGEDDKDFRDSLRSSKEYLVVLKQKRVAIREFYTEVIRDDIKELRVQAAGMNAPYKGEKRSLSQTEVADE